MISINEAKIKVLAEANAYKKSLIKISIDKASGYVLADNLKSKCDSPPFHQSAMDGYGLRYEDISANSKICLQSQSENSAGGSKITRIKPKTAIRIFTGAKVPSNVDVVIPQEDVTLDEQNNLIFNYSKIEPFDNIRSKGSQFKKGEIIIKKGSVMNAPRIALAASAGYSKINTYAYPSVTIIVSGNELIAPGKPLSGDKIYESNSIMLGALLKENNISLKGIKYVKDNAVAIKKAIKGALSKSEIVLISGGISVGKYDLVKETLMALKTETVFYKVKQKPGKPIYFGRNGKKYVFGLPGNPAASLTCFYEYVVPFIKAIYGSEHPFSPLKKSKLLNAYSKKPGLTHFLKGYVSEEGLTILPDQESYKLTSFAESNCLVVIPEEASEIKEGNLVDYHLI